MPIYRTEKIRDYVVMSNVFLQRKDLSIKAKGLLAYMLSLPDDWKFTIGGLTSQLKECKSSVSKMLKELEQNGYLRRNYSRTVDGRISVTIYEIYESPMLDKPTLENPTLENPTLENPTLEKSQADNPQTVLTSP